MDNVSFKASILKGMSLKSLTSFSDYNSFEQYCISSKPALCLICEGHVKWFWKAGWKLRKIYSDIPIVCGCDTQWTGNHNNWIKKILFPFLYGRCFTHIQCAGLWQVVYALKIGFKRSQILIPFYSADCNLYDKVDLEHKRDSYPKAFIYVGQLVERKGVHYLLQAWSNITDRKGWKLIIVGNGPMKDIISERNDIELHPFMTQSEICNIMENCGCAIMPSLYEPWGLVLHEAVAAALPVIVTKKFGACAQFAVNGMNGYTVEEGSIESIQEAMQKIIDSDPSLLIKMAEYSRLLSKRIMPIDVASALVSTIIH